MAISINNGSNPAKVYFNGQEVGSVNFNGTQIWAKPAAGTWKNAWSGIAYIFDLEMDIDFSSYGEYSYTHTFSGITVPDITQRTIQADAEFMAFDYPEMDFRIQSEYLTAARNNNSEATNLPWTSYTSYCCGTLGTLVQDGSNTTITASADYFYLWGSNMFGGFIVTNLWYYDK